MDALAEGDDAKMELSEEEQVKQLRAVAERYKEKFEGSNWIKDVLTGF